VTNARADVDERAEAYLDGELSAEEAAAFERELAARPEFADALGAAIVLRDLLESMPPAQPPAGLEERIVGALGLGRARATPLERAPEEARPSLVAPLRASLSGASWLFRPSAALVSGGLDGARPAAAGLGQVRWLLGPLAPRRAEPEAAPRPAWRRVVGGLLRLGGKG